MVEARLASLQRSVSVALPPRCNTTRSEWSERSLHWHDAGERCPSFTSIASNANGFVFGNQVTGSPYSTGAPMNAGSGTPLCRSVDDRGNQAWPHRYRRRAE